MSDDDQTFSHIYDEEFGWLTPDTEKQVAPIWKSKEQHIYQGWIDAILTEASDELTEWETNFVSSLQDQLLKKGRLSEAQEKILDRIYTEKTA